MPLDLDALSRRFNDVFDAPPTVAARAPGRVNLIGEHTDYNGGYVLPMAIEREVVLVAAPLDEPRLALYATHYEEHASIDLDAPARLSETPWADYLAGVAAVLGQAGLPVRGARILIDGDVPVAAGLSSSAALEMAAVRLFEALGGFNLDDADAARYGQAVENDFLGLGSGIMDQFVSRAARADHAVFLDCRSLAHELVPVALPAWRFVIANTCCSRRLTASKYNERVEECRRAVALLRAEGHEGASHLRDFGMKDLEAGRNLLDEVTYRRARHVISEDRRTVAACEALRNGDVTMLGDLMNESDRSLREDYEVTSPELDAMTRIARDLEGCGGARMTGAGFGGCTVNLVEAERVEAFSRALLARYREETGIAGEVIVSRPAGGAASLVLGGRET